MESLKNVIENEHIFIVEVEEVLQKLVAIKADSKEEALKRAKEKYKNCELILNEEDFKETSFKIYEYNDPREIIELVITALANRTC